MQEDIMQITYIEISNYRNLDGIKITLNPKNNFLIGENELGKSNLLNLLDTVFNYQRFSTEDFSKRATPIRIDFGIHLSDAEKGIFEDHITPDNNNLINIYAIQDDTDQDEDVSFYWKEGENTNPSEIPSSLIKKINYIFYDSLKLPQDELTFYKGRGSGKFLTYLINEFVDTDVQIDVNQAMNKVTGRIQNIFNRIKPLKKQGLGLNTDKENSSDFASRVLKLSGIDGFDILKSGYGTQFSTLLLLSILERLVRIKQNKRFRKFEEKREYFSKEEYQVFEFIHLGDEDTKSILAPVTRIEDDKYFINYRNLPKDEADKLAPKLIEHIDFRKHISMVLGLDEPEIHLHPYLQRSLIKYVSEILENKDVDFSILLKEYFDIDTINGQILTVSHAPTVLSNEHKEYIRFLKSIKIEVVSGASLQLDQNSEKHLMLNLPYIKEAFFAKCVIVVEGETEQGAIPVWANKIIGDLDDLGIIVINASSCSNVPPITLLLNHFKIPNVSIIDKDEKNDQIQKYTSIDGLRTTSKRDFEEELYETIRSTDANVSILFEFLVYYGERGLKRYVQIGSLSKTAITYSIPETWDKTKTQFTFEEVRDLNDENLTKAAFLAWMTRDQIKTITLGRAFGQFLQVEKIPNTYKQLFLDAKGKT